ncbi:TPA: PGF-pre-PGF domain-containing protein [Candidatus Woesearchaeota archaeon]|nr:PGF-pre-PGF domain-containing protein [Candidatus Woesearchaeota archaeon]
MRTKTFLLVTIILFVSLLLTVNAGFPNFVSIDVFNLSSGSSSQGGGFVVSSTNGKLTNGTSLTYDTFNPVSSSLLNLSGIININLTLLRNGSHGNYVNVTFGWILTKSNGSTMLNVTVHNATGDDTFIGPSGVNASSFNYTFNTNLLPDGIYNLSVHVENMSDGQSINGVVNYSRGFDIAIDRTAPNITIFGMSNISNGSNVTGGVIFFNASINDSVTFAKYASIELQNNFRNGTTGIGFNVTLDKNFSGFHTALILSTMTDGFYTVRVYANDSLDNVNMSVANLSFTIDRTAPNVTNVLTNYSGDGFNFTTARKIELNATVNDSTTYVTSVVFSLDNGNGTTFNVTGARALNDATNASTYVAQLFTSTIREGYYTVRVMSNDTLGNLNQSETIRFGFDGTAPNVTQFLWNDSLGVLNASNLTGSVLSLNLTVNDSALTVQEVRVSFSNNFRNGTSGIGFNVTLLRNLSNYHAAVDLSTLTDGFYTLFVFANDTVNNMNNSLSNLSFRLDRTPPNVTTVIVGNLTGKDYYNMSIGLSEELLGFNATINDSTTTVHTVKFSFNSTNGTEENITVVVVNSVWNVTLNLSRLTEGAHSIRIYANDTLGNLNKTEYATFNLDRTLPTVSVSCSPSGPTSGETVTCTCTASDGGSGLQTSPVIFEGDTDNVQSSDVTASGTSSICRVQDFAGNVKTATGSWSVTAATSSSGSGTGGSGGGSSSGVTGQFANKVWTSINAGETASVPVANGALGVTEVSFAVEKTTYGASIKVDTEAGLPSTIAPISTKVYKIVKITENNVEKVLKGTATIKFKVEKTWLEGQKLKKDDVAMLRYNEGKWGQLPTTLGEEDDTYVHYSAETPGFSYFVIGQRTGVAAETVVAPVEPAPVSEPVAEAPAEEPAVSEPGIEPTESKKSSKVWLVPVLIVIVLGVLFYWYSRKKQ